MSRISWTQGRIDTLIACLRGARSLEEAVAEAGQSLGVDLTRNAVDGILRRAGMGSPLQYLGTCEQEPTFRIVDDDAPTDEYAPPLPRAPGWAVESPTERILFVPDCHHPYVDQKAWALMLHCARRFQPNRIVVLGDFLDCYMVSDHDKDPRRASQLDYEIEVANEALDQLDSLGAEHKHYIEGNHEARLGRYIMRHAPALLDTVKLTELLRLEERGWSYTPYLQSLRIGDLHATHCCENAGMNAHRQAAGLYMGSVVIGHTHRMGVDQFGARGKSYTASMFGWLGSDPEAGYLSQARKQRYWTLGFGVGWMRADGTVHTAPVPIVDYHAVMNGEVVRLAA